jgi:hypothetical protein
MASTSNYERYKQALRALRENAKRERQAGIREETPEYLELNQAVLVEQFKAFHAA